MICKMKLCSHCYLNALVYSRVMAPPGGATHINVFETPEPETQKPINKCQEARSKSSVFAGPEEMNPSRDTSSVSRQTHVSAPDDKAAQSTSTKVLAPPGGRANFSIFASGNEEAKPQGNLQYPLDV